MQEYRITEVAGRGRCFQAAKGYRPGDKIYSEEPYEAVLYDNDATSRCHHTFEKPQQLHRCTGCRFARYSSKMAQRAAWANGHKEECAALKACAPRTPPATIRLAARGLWKHHRTSQNQDGLPECIDTLEHHWQDLPDSRKQTFAQMAVLTREYMAGAGSVDSAEPKLIAYLIARFSCNNHTICDEELQVVGEEPLLTRLAMSGYSQLQACIGVGLYPVGAMLNHSCTPNAMQSFAGRRIIFRAIQPIAAGQEATISYVELSATRAERRAALLAGYCFDIDADTDAGAPPLAKRALPAYDGVQAELKMYSGPPHIMNQHDVELTSLSATLGANAALQDYVKATLHPAAPQEYESETELPGSSDSVSQPAILKHGPGAVIECWKTAGTQDKSQLLQDAGVCTEKLQAAYVEHRNAEVSLSAGNTAGAIAAVARGLAQLDSCLPHSQGHIWRLRLLTVMLRAQVLQGSCWPEALAVAEQITPFYKQLYPQVWPNMGLHQACIAKLASLLEHDYTALQAVQAAVDILQYTHPDSSILQQQLRLRHDLLDVNSSAARVAAA